MTETFLSLVPEYGAALVGLVTFLSCLALPVPSSLVMLAAGAFVAAGDLAAVSVIGAALGGAVAGDQAGYALGRWGGGPLWRRLKRRPGSAAMVARADAKLKARALPTVFFSRWLFSPLGPYVNLLSGAAHLPHLRFTLAGIAGEALWVGLYTGLGAAFAAQVETLGETLSTVAGTLAAGLVTVLLGRALWRAAHEGRN